MNKQDENALTDAWHSDTNWLNEKVDDLFKGAQDHAYVLGLSRGIKDAEEKLATQHALIVQMAKALESACDHIEMGAIEVSHCKDHERITQAIAATQYLKGPKT